MDFRPSLVLVALTAAAGCSSSPSVLDCAKDADCGAGNVCVQGACAVNSPPITSFDPPTAATTHRLYTLVPASSDPEGQPVTLGWSAKATVDGCEPDAEPVAGGALEVVFWCAGTYEVTLVPVDDLGAEGAAVVRSFEVAAATGAPSVTAGPAIAATHSCDASIPSCLVLGPDGSLSLQLAASATDPADAALAFEWVALPPPGPAADPLLLLTFVTADVVAAPIASIANGSGGPIAGVYRFRVRVQNPQGLLGQAFQEVVVGNGPPTAAAGAPSLPHAYVDGQYVVEADVATGASDPDGDAVVVEGSLSPAPAEGCVEEVTASATPGALHVRIACSSATALIGDAPRALSVTITDSNGAATTCANPLTVENRAPELVLSPSLAEGVLLVDHRVEPCEFAAASSCFVADGEDPFVAVDPDGDPVTGFALAASVDSGRIHSMGSAWPIDGVERFRFETPVGYALEFRSAAGVTGFVVSASVFDSLGAKGSVEMPLFVGNRSPTVKEPSPAASVNHSYDAAARRYVATATGALFEDPDGDPLTAAIVPAGPCGSVTLDAGRATIGCQKSWDFALGGVPPLGSFLAGGGVLVTATDGWEQVGAGTYVTILDRPATVAVPLTAIEHCSCAGLGSCIPFGANLVVPVTLVDPDGDPSIVTISGPAVYAGVSVTCLPGTCHPIASIPGAGTTSVTVTADSGAPGAHPSVGAGLTVTCSSSG
jgi:hypothetical protein